MPTESVTETVALFAPVAWPVWGLNCTVTTQVAPGARVVLPISCPPPAAPHVDSRLTMLNSVGFVPPSVPCPMPVKGWLPVLVSVKT